MAKAGKKKKAKKKAFSKGQIVFLVLATIFILLSIFFIPKYYGIGKANKAITEGSGFMAGGDFARGSALVRYGLEQYKLSNGAVPRNVLNAVRAAAWQASVHNPLESLPALELLHDYGIGLTCKQKEDVVTEILKWPGKFHKQKDLERMSNSLFVAAVWAQDCKFSDKPEKRFKDLMEAYSKKRGGAPAEPWFAAAKARQTVDKNRSVKILSQKDLDKQNKVPLTDRMKEIAASFKYDAKRLAGIFKKSNAAGPKSKAGKTDRKTAVKKNVSGDKPGVPAPEALKQPADKSESTEAESKTNTAGANKVTGQISAALAGKGLKAVSVEFSKGLENLTVTLQTSGAGDYTEETKIILDIVYEKAGAGQAGAKPARVAVAFKNAGFEWVVKTSDYEAFSKGRLSESDFVNKKWTREKL
jgi:hypothetical protein